MKLRTVSLAFAVALVVSACGGTEPDIQASTTSTETTQEATLRDNSESSEVATQSQPGAGGGTVVVDDVTYTFVAQNCFPSPGNFSTQGLATSTGEYGDAWISISGGINQDYDDDGTADVTADVTIEHGKTELFGESDPEKPEYAASRLSFSTQPAAINEGVLDFEINGSTMTGSGQMSDWSGIAVPFGETVDFTFEASC